MPEAYIYDHVRTPRGRGKSDGALHEVTALRLATVPLEALKERNNLPVDSVDDVMSRSPQTIRVFLQFKMRCVGCPIACFHTVDDACREHGVDRVAFFRALTACT